MDISIERSQEKIYTKLNDRSPERKVGCPREIVNNLLSGMSLFENVK